MPRLGVSAIALLALSASIAAQDTGWRAKPQTVEQTAKQQPAFNYDEARVPPYTLPDPLTLNGTTVRTRDEWTGRRLAILELFREHVYGRSPGRPQQLRFEVVEENPRAMEGAATLKRIAVIGVEGGRTHRFEITLFLPNARREPVPVFLLLNNRPANQHGSYPPRALGILAGRAGDRARLRRRGAAEFRPGAGRQGSVS